MTASMKVMFKCEGHTQQVTEHSSIGCATGLVEGASAFSGAMLVRSAKDVNRAGRAWPVAVAASPSA